MSWKNINLLVSRMEMNNVSCKVWTERIRNDKQYTLIYTTPLFYVLAPTPNKEVVQISAYC
jgi:hypothetical protein